jgi:MtN3 and saliva related transmembrane protein
MVKLTLSLSSLRSLLAYLPQPRPLINQQRAPVRKLLGDLRVLDRCGERTMQQWWPAALGMIAGLCTSFSFVPQVIKAWRYGDTEAISKRMYVASLAAYGLWIVHGLMIASTPVILFNALNFIFAGTLLGLKLRTLRSSGAQ